MAAKEKLGDENAFIIAKELELLDFDEKNLRCCCPFHDESTPSFIYNRKTFSFRCFGACSRNYDIVDVFIHKGMTYLQACQKLFELAGIKYSFGELGVRTRHQYRYPKEVICDDKSAVYRYFKYRKISKETLDYADVRQDVEGNAVFNYYDTNDVLTMVKYRPSRKIHKGEGKCWCQKGADTTSLLFNMNRINTSAPLLITEGECFPGDAEVLTPDGWVRLDSYEGQEVLQVTKDLSGNFVMPIGYIKKSYNGNMHIIRKGGNYSSITTPGHNIVFYDYCGRLTKRPVSEMPTSIGGSGYIPTCINMDGEGIQLSYEQIALYLAVSADCTMDHRTTGKRFCRFSVKKQRKFERMKYLLESLGISHYVNPMCSDGSKYFGFHTPEWITSKILPWEWINKASLKQREFILDELIHWDGNTVNNRTMTEYSTKCYENAQFVQTLAHLAGKMSTISKRSNGYGEWYKVSILHSKKGVSWQKGVDEIREYTGNVYCVTVPSGMILVRQEGHITVSGNCDCLSAIEAGYPNAVSVPFGSGNYNWIEENWDWLEQFDNIIICADNDEAGIKMQKETVYRIGSWRTKVVEMPPEFEIQSGKKRAVNDLNEVLYYFGKEKVLEIILNAKDSPVPGVIDFSDIKDVDLDQIDGITTGIKPLDRYLMKLFNGTLNIVTGINGCVDAETEYFNGTEWKKISAYQKEEQVLQYMPDGTASLTTPLEYHKYPCDHFWLLKSQYGVCQCVSDEHNLVYLTSKRNIQKKRTLELIEQHHESKHGFQGKFITSFSYSGSGIALTDDEIRLMCAVICNGSILRRETTSDICRINIKKKCKKERLRGLLNAVNVSFTSHQYNPYETYDFTPPIATTTFGADWYHCTQKQLYVIADEVLFWSSGRRRFSTTDKYSADFIQFVFSACGYRSVVTAANRIGEMECFRKSIEYNVSMTSQVHPTIFNSKEKIQIPRIKSVDGFKYCFTVPSGMLVLRRDGCINITGNSGKSSFLNQIICQSLEQDKNVFLFSGELPNFQTKNWLNSVLAGQHNVIEKHFQDAVYYKVKPEAKREIENFYRGKLFIYEDGKSNKKSDLMKTMEDSVRKYGTKLLILDNLTAISLECNDNNKYDKQGEFIMDLISFAVKFNVIVILVVHPHKIDTMRRLNKMDVQGISAIIDLAHRIISLYRVSEKDKAGEPRYNGNGWKVKPVKEDVQIDILKDRMLGFEGRGIGVYYDSPSRRFFTSTEDLDRHYAWEKSPASGPLPFPPKQLEDSEDDVFGTIAE